jgi:RHS repeat-associated protein
MSYDLSGQLLGLYESGAPEEEIVWLGALPVGTIQGGAAYSIAPDHLGAPYKIVNSANAQVWFWDHDPFGNGAPTAAAGFWHRLRFPGQVYDSESKLHSNGQRDYDPRLGRYLESDPIGLEGGINTYAYAGNYPVDAIDPLGLYRTSRDGDPNALPDIDIEAQQLARSTPAELPPIDIGGTAICSVGYAVDRAVLDARRSPPGLSAPIDPPSEFAPAIARFSGGPSFATGAGVGLARCSGVSAGRTKRKLDKPKNGRESSSRLEAPCAAWPSLRLQSAKWSVVSLVPGWHHVA